MSARILKFADYRERSKLCPRTLALFWPGVRLPGVTCSYAYTGSMPCTGPRVCHLCGRRAP